MNAAVLPTPLSSEIGISRPWGWCAAGGLALSGALLHLLYLTWNCPLDLSGDEAHYWEWSRRLDWSYYSKGPLVAWIIAASRWLLAGVSERLVGTEMLAVRAPALLLSAITTLGVYRLAEQTLGRPGVALAAAALTWVTPILVVGSLLMTIDAPLAALWVWALVALQAGVRRAGWGPWVLLGGLTALGILAKYNMLMLSIVATWHVSTLAPEARRRAWRGLGVALPIAALGLLPIVIWNAAHDWVSFRHVAGQAGLSAGGRINPLGPFEFAAGQWAVIGLAWLPLMLVAAWRRARESGPRHLLAAATIVPFAVFLLFSPFTKIQPNWPVVGVLSGLILLADQFHEWLRAAAASVRRRAWCVLLAGCAYGVLGALVVHRSDWFVSLAAPLAQRLASPLDPTPLARFDPAARLRGWRELGAAAGAQLTALQQPAGAPEPLLLADDYQVASQLAFYTPGKPVVYCVQAALGKRRSQYDLWPGPLREPGAYIGRPCLFVGSRSPRVEAAMPGLRHLQLIEHHVGGHAVAAWSLWHAPQFVGFATTGSAGHRY